MFQEALFWGALVSILTSALILGSLAYNPRIWIGDAPEEMQEGAAPLTPAEKRTRSLWAIPILVTMFVLLPLIAVWRNQTFGFTYFEGFAFLWIAFMVFNVVDLVIIDWLIIVWWRPGWAAVPEVDHLAHYNTYSFHFKGFLKGCVYITVWSALIALLFLLL